MLTVREVGLALRVSEKTVRRLIERDGLPVFRVGGSIRVDAVELAKWLYEVRGDCHAPAMRPDEGGDAAAARGASSSGRRADDRSSQEENPHGDSSSD